MRYIVLGAAAALALAVTAGSASAQHHGGHSGRGYPAYSPGYAGHGFNGHYAPSYHQPGGHIGHPGGGFYASPSYGGGFGLGVVTGPAYYPAYPVSPGIGYAHGHYSHHGRHH